MDRPKRILIIEDHLERRTWMTDIFLSVGYQVEAAQYLASKVGAAISGEFDLITLDLGLPEIDGLEVAKLLSDSTDTPVLVVSAAINDDVVKQLEQVGLQHYLAKPFGVTDLLVAAEKAMSE